MTLDTNNDPQPPRHHDRRKNEADAHKRETTAQTTTNAAKQNIAIHHVSRTTSSAHERTQMTMGPAATSLSATWQPNDERRHRSSFVVDVYFTTLRNDNRRIANERSVANEQRHGPRTTTQERPRRKNDTTQERPQGPKNTDEPPAPRIATSTQQHHYTKGDQRPAAPPLTNGNECPTAPPTNGDERPTPPPHQRRRPPHKTSPPLATTTQ
ncbi:hypothetical protein K443DRAFT_5805 [Laccaria amethystina LaAM-08-1]|uniref:Uncharacterized protein n=1 Tax=Laccaria amethystina LaAM-08-1 TaxID=1095629 RepID=A0A0C9XDJ2_9AGAR|nr:hypothetical protein K443DRAFT_5805 [Laccaria amethystina LaAM-08-1]